MKKIFILILLLILVGCQLKAINYVEFSDNFEYLKKNDNYKNKELENSWQSQEVAYVEVKYKNSLNNLNIVTVAKYDATQIYNWFNIYSKDKVIKIKENLINLNCDKEINKVSCYNEKKGVIKYVFIEGTYIIRILCVGDKFSSTKRICEKLYSEITN